MCWSCCLAVTHAPQYQVVASEVIGDENANVLYERDSVLIVADLHIYDDAILIYRKTGLFCRLKKERRETKNFQQRGIGRELLKYVFAVAVEKGMKQIVGKIKEVDYPKNPNLPKWYESMGFKVTMEAKKSAVIAIISKEL